MKIGLVRHFEVDNPPPIFMTSEEFIKWSEEYDIADVIENEVGIDESAWHKCYASDLPRAVTTAKDIYQGDIEITKNLREIPVRPIFRTNIKLPYKLWILLGKLGWLFSHKSQEEFKTDTEKRVEKFLDNIKYKKGTNTLIVCHGYIMNSIRKELIKRGFTGDEFKRAENGKLYTFVKEY